MIEKSSFPFDYILLIRFCINEVVSQIERYSRVASSWKNNLQYIIFFCACI